MVLFRGQVIPFGGWKYGAANRVMTAGTAGIVNTPNTGENACQTL
jgi:hypothetical protein